MFLTAYKIGGLATQRAIIDIATPTDVQLAGNEPLKWEATVSADYADVTTIENMDLHYFLANINIKEIRNEMISTFLGLWSTLSDVRKKLLVKWFVYPETATVAELDLLYTPTERTAFKNAVTERLNSDSRNLFSVLKRDSDGKVFKSFIANDGTAQFSEITSYSIL